MNKTVIILWKEKRKLFIWAEFVLVRLSEWTLVQGFHSWTLLVISCIN